jgi:CRISPR system Cascade subunit CasA
MTFSFNLVEEPFVPCTLPDGQAVEYSLRDVLLKAHEIAELRDNSPLVTVALHRLLLAILHRCYQGPRNLADRVAIRQSGAFDVDRINRYFTERADRFDLFHQTFPFYQCAGYAQDEPSAVNRLVKELSRGNNAALFDHTNDYPRLALTPPEAARAVLSEQVFAYSAGRGKKGEPHTLDAPIARAAEVFALGNNLFQTLWLNLTVYDAEGKPIPCEKDDCPIWERTSASPHSDSKTPRGYLDYLTWQSRTLRLHPEYDGDQVVVRRASYSQGRVWQQAGVFYDPFAAYERIADVGDRAIQLRENRDLWRDSAALFQFAETDQFRGPTSLHTLASLIAEGHLAASARYRVMVMGARVESGQPNLIFWRHETLPLPLAYLQRREVVDYLKLALKLAEEAANAVVNATKKAVESRLTAQTGQRPDGKRVSQFVDFFASERFYWSRLELPFRELLVALATEGADQATCINAWYWDTLYLAAKFAFDQSIGRIDAGRDLKAVNIGVALLLSRLKKIRTTNRIPDPKKEGVA